MRVIVIADTHGSENELILPDGDTLVHCGDYSAQGTFHDLVAFNYWLGKQPHKYKICVSGNHDQYASTVGPSVTQEFLSNAIYLENSGVYIEGKTFWGSPYTPLFGHWAFMKKRGNDIAKLWQMIPQEADMLITHGAPQGILDINEHHESCGCYDLRQAIQKRRIHHAVFGHIHEGYGSITLDNTIYSNCSVLNAHYELVNKPVVIDL
jgi:Icc-related predicted phosphoesterase